jgi:hypothetical protein
MKCIKTMANTIGSIAVVRYNIIVGGRSCIGRVRYEKFHYKINMHGWNGLSCMTNAHNNKKLADKRLVMMVYCQEYKEDSNCLLMSQSLHSRQHCSSNEVLT